MRPTYSISNKIPLITPAPVTFPVPSFTRAFIGTFVDSQGLVETASVKRERFDHDPATLATNDLLLEGARIDILTQSNTFTIGAWGIARATVTNSTDFLVFASGGVFLLTGNGQSATKGLFRFMPTSATTRTFVGYLCLGTNNFAQVFTAEDNIVFVN